MGAPPSEAKGFRGLRVVSFESRMKDQMADLISRNGGQPIVAPSMREIPLEENSQALTFGDRLLKNEIDVLILLTGVGTRTLVQVLETRWPKEKIVDALKRVPKIVRGPKPVAALRELGLTATAVAPEPNTWKQLLATLDSWGSVKGKQLAIQEYGATNQELLDGLKKRGAKVLRVPVYRWALPENIEPMRQALKTIIEGEADVVMFTNGFQINNVFQVARQEGLENDLRQALSHVVVASVGPTCTEFLDEYGVPVDMQPEHPKMGNLVVEASQKSSSLLALKRTGEPASRRTGETTSPLIEPASGRAGEPGLQFDVTPARRHAGSPARDGVFLKACRREATPYTPIWLMRQAGRYMKEYRDLRERHSFLDLCKDSDLACEVTVYAAERLGVDAAIIFSDILVVVEPMGLGLEYAKGEGPVIHNPIRDLAAVHALRKLNDAAEVGFVMDAIQKTRKALKPDIPLIGFAGAPFTLASYMIEGQGSRNFIHTKALMYQEPVAWEKLMRKIADSLVVYLQAQVKAGAQALQLFDSWVGCLSPDDYKRFVLPYSQHVIQGLAGTVPIIHFGTGTGTFIEHLRDAGGDVIGLDWRVRLDDAWRRLGPVAVMGNLDPTILFAQVSDIQREAKAILDQAAGRPGHIFNLGHGVLPNTPVGHVKALVDYVHELSSERNHS